MLICLGNFNFHVFHISFDHSINTNNDATRIFSMAAFASGVQLVSPNFRISNDFYLILIKLSYSKLHRDYF